MSAQRPLTDAAKRWKRVDARIQFFPPNDLRRFFSAAAKYLIKPSHWDDPHPITPFDQIEEVQDFHTGFTQYTRQQMLAHTPRAEGDEDDLLGLLRVASEWDRHRIPPKIAKKKLKKLRKRMDKRLSKFGRKHQPLRGLRFYDRVIRKQYLS